MLLNYHVGRFVLDLSCVGVRVRFGWGGIRAAGSLSLYVRLDTGFTPIRPGRANQNRT
jgi:hypothetical protein